MSPQRISDALGVERLTLDDETEGLRLKAEKLLKGKRITDPDFRVGYGAGREVSRISWGNGGLFVAVTSGARLVPLADMVRKGWLIIDDEDVVAHNEQVHREQEARKEKAEKELSQQAAYRARQWATFTTYGTEPADWEFTGEMKEVRDSNGKPVGTCDLCGHSPIAYKFFLTSEKVKSKLGVGSECVENFREARPAEGYLKNRSVLNLEKAEQQVKVAKRHFTLARRLVKDFGIAWADAQALQPLYSFKVGRSKELDPKGGRLYVKTLHPRGYRAEWTPLDEKRLKRLVEDLEGAE